MANGVPAPFLPSRKVGVAYVETHSGNSTYFRQVARVLAGRFALQVGKLPAAAEALPRLGWPASPAGVDVMVANAELVGGLRPGRHGKVGVVLHIDEPDGGYAGGPFRRAYYAAKLRRLRRAAADGTRLVAISQATDDDCLRLLGRRADAVVYPGVDTRFFQPGPEPSPAWPRPYLLFVGNLTARKGADALLDVARRCQGQLDLVAVSQRPPEGGASTAGLHCLNNVPRERLRSLYRGATALLHPALKEGFGYSVAEAMACGAPVITTAVSSLPELVDQRGGFLHAPGDAAGMAASAAALAGDEALRAALGRHNATRAAAFSEGRMAEGLARVIDAACAAPGSVAPAH